jgi:hypothetical protein
MVIKGCPTCFRETTHQRAFGIGTLIACVFSLGLWVPFLVLYPLRCNVCGDKRILRWTSALNYQITTGREQAKRGILFAATLACLLAFYLTLPTLVSHLRIGSYFYCNLSMSAPVPGSAIEWATITRSINSEVNLKGGL